MVWVLTKVFIQKAIRMKKLIYIFLLFPFFGISQSNKIARAVEISRQQANVVTVVYNGQNAADPNNEVNGTANITVIGTELTLSSVTTSPTPQNGSYSLKFTQNAGTNTTARGNITLVGINNGDNVTVSLYCQETVGANWQILLRTSDGWTTNETINLSDGGTWTQYTFSANTATQDDPSIRIQGTSSSDTGDECGVDNIVITLN